MDGFDDVAQTEQGLPNKLPNKLSEAVRNTLSVISADPAVTGRELAERLDVSDRTIREHIKILKEAGLLAREGSNKSGCWKILSTEGSL